MSRLKYPIKRVGERGEDKWERVSWDEAYDIICAHVREYQEKDGPESHLHDRHRQKRLPGDCS